MSAIRQVVAVTEMGMRSLPARLGPSLVVVIGLAAVVAVLVTALAVARGFSAAAARTGDPNRAIVLSGGTTEANSSISREAATTIMSMPGIRPADQGRTLSSADAITFVGVTNLNSGVNAFVTLRGVGSETWALRPEMKVVEGRAITPGTHEVIAGRAVRSRLGLDLGSEITLPNGNWTVVGIFESGSDARESELVTDADTLLGAYGRGDFNSVTVGLEADGGFERFSAALERDPTVSAITLREDEYYGTALQDVTRLLLVVAYGIGSIMTFGAAFGALNTMYSAVSARAIDIATLRAIGYGSPSVVASVLAEALTLGLLGSAIGLIVARLLFHGSTVSTMTGITPAQLTFPIEVTPLLAAIGLGFACGAAIVGGLAASWRVARRPTAVALRAAAL